MGLLEKQQAEQHLRKACEVIHANSGSLRALYLTPQSSPILREIEAAMMILGMQ